MKKRFFEEHKCTMLFLSWRDIIAPKHGGAEVYTHEMLKRVDHQKYQVIHMSPSYENAEPFEVIDNVHYLRRGNALTVLFYALVFFWRNSRNIDFVVDQCNTHRFFTPFWVPKKKRILFIHQLTREIWFRNAKFPFSYLGYWFETWMLKIYRRNQTMTVSQSTLKDLLSLGFDSSLVQIIPEGIDFAPWPENSFLNKEKSPTFIYVGRFARYKGIDDVFKAFGQFKIKCPNAKLWIVGKENENYKRQVLEPICEKYQLSLGKEGDFKDITFFGFVSNKKKLELMSRAYCLVFPSEREGWGLTVTEAAAVGTPSIVYNSPGLIDAVDFGKAGYMTQKNTITELVDNMEYVTNNYEEYQMKKKAAYEYAHQFQWSETASHFQNMMNRITEEVS